MQLLNLTVAFASGIAISVIAAFASYLFQRHKDRKQRREEAAFRIYMLLLDLHSYYFWIASSEFRGEEPQAGVPRKLRRIAMQIADKLREADDIRHLEEILTVLMSEDAYRTARDRSNALNDVIDKIGDTVNPRYAKIARRISEENVRGFIDRPAGHRNNAPMLML